MTEDLDKAIQRAVRFVWLCIAVYLLSASVWILIQRHRGYSYVSVIFETRFIMATISTMGLPFLVWYLARRARTKNLPPTLPK